MENVVKKKGYFRELDKSLGISELLHAEVIDKTAPAPVHWWDHAGLSCFGGLTFLFFIMQTVSGLFLLVYYQPHPDEAYASVQYIDSYVNLGWFFRRSHAICSNLMMITVIIHMLKVFFTGAYKKPREMHWVSGFVLLLFTLGACFTGYCLPWNQMSFWALTVVTNSLSSIPFIGTYLVEFVRGGENVTGVTLLRFFAFHLIIPVTMLIFLLAHFYMIRKTGISEPL
ncbi:MAG: Cytochrome b/b6 domain protein [Ignavibacteria bacterium]|nr:Cytochrome b/b6 domain protein [Ignavibacteria bacterium]